MPPVSPLPFPEAIYNQLPAKERNKLARATGRQSAFSSASLLSNTLKNPAVVKTLPQNSFKDYINKSGQIKWWTRLKLTLRHFYHALFSNYAKLSKDFAKLVERLGKENASKANGKDAATRKEVATAGLLGNRGADFVQTAVATGAGDVIGHTLAERRKNKNSGGAGDGGGDSAIGKTDDSNAANAAEELRSQGREDQDEDVPSESGDDVSEADDDVHSDAESDSGDASDNDPGDDSGGGLFGWLGGGDGGDDGGDWGD